jgi:hypothetical protein
MQSRICGSRRRLRRRFHYHYTTFRPRRIPADERPPPLHYAEAPSRFPAVGLPDGPNIRIRLLATGPSAAPVFKTGRGVDAGAQRGATLVEIAVEKRLRRLDEQGLMNFDVAARPLPHPRRA